MDRQHFSHQKFMKLRPVFFQTGLIIAIALTLYAFSYRTSYNSSPPGKIFTADTWTTDEIPDIQIEKPKPEIEDQTSDENLKNPDLDPIIGEDETKPIEQEPEKRPNHLFTDEVPDDRPIEPEIFTVVEQMPEFPGGNAALNRFLNANLVYPRSAHENGITGVVKVEFLILEDGTIGNIKVVKDIKWGCGEEAARVVGIMPRWYPGKQRNKTVIVRFVLPVKFEISK